MYQLDGRFSEQFPQRDDLAVGHYRLVVSSDGDDRLLLKKLLEEKLVAAARRAEIANPISVVEQLVDNVIHCDVSARITFEGNLVTAILLFHSFIPPKDDDTCYDLSFVVDERHGTRRDSQVMIGPTLDHYGLPREGVWDHPTGSPPATSMPSVARSKSWSIAKYMEAMRSCASLYS